MFYVTRAMTGGMRLYNYCYDAAIECAKCNIKRRLTANEKIRSHFSQYQQQNGRQNIFTEN